MKSLNGLSISLAVIFLIGCCDAKSALLGRKECTYGPSYWCENFPQAKQCNAFQHCKQTVWEKTIYPVDNDEICKICLDMVTQARDQLRSNETLDDLRAVFEGSCALIHIKMVVKECDKLVDDFIPELVEALSSEMDPTAVCSVAGLCNNKKIDQLLLEQQATQGYGAGDKEYQAMYGDFNCKDCRTLGNVMVEKFKRAEPEDTLSAMIEGCAYTGSFSDSCHSLAVKYFQQVHDILKQRLTTDNMCHLSGACYLDFHKHETKEPQGGLEVRPMGNVGMLRPNGEMDDDIPCDLCKQLMVHLRDIVLANSTEKEFKTVLDGICGELGPLEDECTNIVDNYSDAIFNVLNKGLNETLACELIKICPSKPRGLVMPLLLMEPQKIEMSLKKKEQGFTKQEIDAFQLPFDTLMGPQNADQLVQNGQVCAMCEMVMHFVQQSLAEQNTEQEIKEAVEGACKIFPRSVQSECDNFVESYGDAVIAMLIQELDPSEVCPAMKMCSQRVKEDVEIFRPTEMNVEIQSKEKPTCPLCLFAVTEAQTRIQSDKSVENVKRTLETLCNHLPQKLHVECTDFVDSYAKMLIELLVKDVTPQQICVQLKLCTETGPKVHWMESREDIMDNEIPDNTYNGRVVVMGKMKATSTSTPECLMCQHFVKELEKKLDDNKSREKIKKILDHACDKVKESLKDKCIAFIDKHEEQIIELVMKGVQPKELCVVLGFCMISERDLEKLEDFGLFRDVAEDLNVDEAFSVDFISVPAGPSAMGRIQLLNKQIEDRIPPNVRANEQCVLCEFVMTKLEQQLKDKKTEDEIRDAVEGICNVLPKSVSAPCKKFVDGYSELIISILTTVPPAQICQEIKMCTPPPSEEMTTKHQEVMQSVSNDVLECAVCQGAMTIIDRLLEDKDFDHNLEQVVEKTCRVAPKLYKKKCAELVNSYGPSIINMLLLKMQPEKVCEEIQLCFPNEYSTFVQINDEVIPSRIRRDVLGANECTWGPGFWCASLKNAQKCNAEDHCLKNKWNGVAPEEVPSDANVRVQD